MRRRLVLCCAPQFLIALDFSVMTVAIAPLAGELGLSGERAALVLAAYSLPFGSLLVGSGLLVDRVGPRRCLAAGFALFACGGLGAVGAQDGPAMLVSRAVQGAGAAAIVPAGLAITTAALAGSCAVCLATGGYGGVPALAGATAAAVALGVAARAHRRALVPRDLARDRGFRLVVAGAAIVTASGVSGSLLLSLHLQTALGYSPVQTALVFVGFGLVALAGRRCTAALGRRGGDVLGRGLALQGIGLAALATTLVLLPVPIALVAVTSLFGLGHVVANSGVALGTAATPAGSHGLAAALVASAQYVSGALGSLAMVGERSGALRLAAVGVVALLAGVALDRRMWIAERRSGS